MNIENSPKLGRLLISLLGIAAVGAALWLLVNYVFVATGPLQTQRLIWALGITGTCTILLAGLLGGLFAFWPSLKK